MSTIYRAGVIGRTGKGDYGHGLDVAFARVPNAKLVAISDDNPDGLVAAGKKTGVNQLYTDYREMLAKEQLDLVCVAPRYVDCHAEMVIAAAEAGVKGIFCEKPLARTLAEADAMLATCAKSRTRLAVAHRRANPYEWHGKKLVDEGHIGKVQRMVGRGKGDHRAGGILSLRHSPGGELYLYCHGMWIPGEGDPQWERILLDEWETKPDGTPRSGTERMHESNRLIVEELIQAIEEDRDVVQSSSGHDARAALEMIMAVHESQRLQQRVTFPLRNRENPYQVWLKESKE